MQPRLLLGRSIPAIRAMLVRLSALTLLELRVLLVDDVQTPFATDDLAVRGAWFEGGPDLHGFLGSS
jgi:hypothetical protein